MARPKKQAEESAAGSSSNSNAGAGTSSSASATTTAKSTITTATKKSSKSKKQPVLETLRTVIPTIFQESQKTTANHRKNAIMLRKIQEQCAETGGDNGEVAFNKEFIRNLNVVLAIKKNEPTADRVIQALEEEKERNGEGVDQDEEEQGDISSRFVEYLMLHLLKGITVKEKLVRVRCCKLIALSTNSMGAMDNDLYIQLKKSLMERARDKESAVRIQAIFALAKLQDDDDEEDPEEGDNVVQKLLDLMQHDPAGEVRRSAIFNIEQSKVTLPYILERARDTDTYSRRAVFTKPMSELQDFRVLSIGEREKLLRYGLSDRDEGVKKACTRMLATRWIQQADDNLLEFLERLDVMGSDVAEDVLTAFFRYREDVIGSLTFNDLFWVNLTVESSFLVRVCAEFCHNKNGDMQDFERVVPEVSRLAFYIQKYSNIMQLAEEDDRPEAEFIVTQLLMIARLLDYGDEAGRRKMFTLLREMLMLSDLLDKHLDCIVETMSKISLNEKDFTRIVIEIVSDIRAGPGTDTDQQQDDVPHSEDELNESPDDDTMELTNAEGSRKRKHSSVSRRNSTLSVNGAEHTIDIMLNNVRCLTIIKYMLERSAEPLMENSYMFGLLNEIVIPALGMQEEVMQDLGLQCLGLICALDEGLAKDNMDLFLTCVFAENANTHLHVLSLKIVFDLILTFGMTAMSPKLQDERIETDLTRALESDTPELQAIAAEGIAKLMLTKLLKSPEILRKMIILYFDPATAENNHLRQCLNYFLQVYFHSAYENQVLLSEMAVPIMVQLIEMQEDAKDDMPAPVSMAQQLLEWCEPRRGLEADPSKGPVNEAIDYGLQANIAIEIVKALFSEAPYVRKTLPNILHKIPLDDDAGEIRLKKLTLLIGNLKTKRPIAEKQSKKYLLTVEKNILKMFGDAPEGLDDDELTKLAELTEEISFVDGFVAPAAERSEFVPIAKSRKPRATKPAAKSKISDKLKRMEEEIDAKLELESSSSEKEDGQDDDSASDVYDEEDDVEEDD
ncbi:hypothetical protein BGX29_003425 [Mortierella sp. GBA35]|nr:hypothetical protein BGX29_003425 [Mortierella sp. GBA35]